MTDDSAIADLQRRYAAAMTPADKILEADLQGVVLRGQRDYGEAAFNSATDRLKASMTSKQWGEFRKDLAGRSDGHELVYDAARGAKTIGKYGKVENGVPDALWNAGYADKMDDKEAFAEIDRRMMARRERGISAANPVSGGRPRFRSRP